MRHGRWIAALGAVLIATLTLVPHPDDVDKVALTPLWCLACGGLGMVDVLLNIALFIPYGFGLRVAGLSRGRTQLIVCLTTLAIELLQLTVIAGRDATLSDLLTNSLGGALGILLAERWTRLLFPDLTSARFLARLWVAGWLGLWMVAGSLVSLALPPTLWYGQFAPVGVFPEAFSGTSVSATLGDTKLSDGPLSQTESVRTELLAGEAPLHVVLVSGGGPPVRTLASVFSIFDQVQREILILGQHDRDLVFRIRTRLSRVRLRNIAIRLPGALEHPGERIEAIAIAHDGRISLQAKTEAGTQKAIVSLTPSMGWLFVLPFEYFIGPEAFWVTAVWVAAWMVPLGFWAARGHVASSSDTGRSLVLLGGLVIFGLTWVPLVAGVPPVPWTEWLGAAAGVGGGWMLGAASLRYSLQPQRSR